MRQSQTRTKDKRVSKKEEGAPRETDPLLGVAGIESHHHGVIRSRRSSRSPAFRDSLPMNPGMYDDRYSVNTPQDNDDDTYELHNDTVSLESEPQHAALGARERSSNSRTTHSTGSEGGRSYRWRQSSSSYYRPPNSENSSQQQPFGGDGEPPLLEIPEEIYAVRKAALRVLKPLIGSWLVVSVGFAISMLLGMAKWTELIHDLPYWFILLPSWGTHVGLLVCHVKSAQALSRFISEANENRQRPDSTDHLDRTEYLPLLQRSLKFGLKTGLLSFCTFIFEVLMYVRVARGNLPLGIAFIPIWLIVVGGILDGVLCKSQHFLRTVCWILMFAAMILAVLRVDYDIEAIRWRFVVSPIVAVLSISSATLIYIVYGHQVGYYRLTESQLTAGILYSMAALICIVLVILIGELMPLSRPVEIETRFFVVVMAPLVVCLVGMGAWAVSRDEFGRLLLYGGQTAVHPMKLRWEANGWNLVQGKGVSIIPMFGEVSYRPLERYEADGLELCACCNCYPYEDEEAQSAELSGEASYLRHPYISSQASQASSRQRDNDSSSGSRL